MQPTNTEEIAAAAELLQAGRVVTVTGAGMSTDSGIPDYRGPNSAARRPMTFSDFTSSAVQRQRYWARSHVGWRRMRRAAPNAGHRALARLEASSLVSGLITQNVDRLHADAGSRRLIELHGRIDRVICLACGERTSRADLDLRLAERNPGWEDAHPVQEPDVAPDGDAAIDDSHGFVVVDCTACGGVLKPDLVFFGENVPVDRVEQCYRLLANARALLVAGSSLTVFSGRRFVRRAYDDGLPIVIVNRGATRGDQYAELRIEGGCSEVLSALADALAPQSASAGPAGAPPATLSEAR